MNEIDLIKKEFDYSVLDLKTTDFLKQKESVMSEIVGKAYTELGCQLKEAQDELSKRGYGCFEEWYTSLGYKKVTVYNMINRYNLIVQNLNEQPRIEGLPVSLSYEIAKPSVNAELKQQVLAGEIATNKQFKELEAKLKQSESDRIRLESLTIVQQQELNKERSKPALVDTESLKRIAELEAEAERQENKGMENIRLQLEIKRMRQDFEDKLTKRENDTHNVRKLREALKNMITAITMEQTNAKYYYSLVVGTKDANEAVQAFIRMFDPKVQEVFKVWQEAYNIPMEEVVREDE